jgi:hypothetical protein
LLFVLWVIFISKNKFNDVDVKLCRYRRVRLMVATLRAVGAGDIAPDQMQALLDKKNPNAVPAMVGGCTS